MTSEEITNSDQPLLTAADVDRPLELKYLEDAQNMLPPSFESADQQAHRQQALGFLLQRAGNVLLNPLVNQSQANDALESYYESVREAVETDGFLDRLVTEMIAVDKPHGLRGIVASLRQRRARAAEQAPKVSRQQELEALRNRAFEASKPRVALQELKVGDQVKLWLTERNRVTVDLEGTVEGLETQLLPGSRESKDTLALRVKDEHRIILQPGYVFTNPRSKEPGTVTHIRGVWSDGDILRGHGLSSITSDGDWLTYGEYYLSKGGGRAYPSVKKVTINGIDIFPES